MHVKRKHYIWTGVLVLPIVALIGARIYLPYWMTDYVNNVLTHIPGYTGSVQNIDVHLYRGAYKIRGLQLSKTRGNIPVPFLSIAETDLSIQWGALLHGRIVSDIHMLKPVVNFAVNKSGTVTQTGEGVDWTRYIDKLMPIDINIVTFRQGKVAYRDFSAKPEVNIDVHDLSGQLENLRNVDGRNQGLPSTLTAQGVSIGNGKLRADGKLNVLRKVTDMDMDVKLENVSLPALNSYVREHAGIDFETGNLSVYSEFAVKNSRVTGYVKPIATDISVVSLKNDGGPLELLWESIASIIIEIFENQPRDQFATKIEIEGTLGDVGTNSWSTIAGILRNAFVKAFDKGTEGEVLFK